MLALFGSLVAKLMRRVIDPVPCGPWKRGSKVTVIVADSPGATSPRQVDFSCMPNEGLVLSAMVTVASVHMQEVLKLFTCKLPVPLLTKIKLRETLPPLISISPQS